MTLRVLVGLSVGPSFLSSGAGESPLRDEGAASRERREGDAWVKEGAPGLEAPSTHQLLLGVENRVISGVWDCGRLVALGSFVDVCLLFGVQTGREV